MPASPLRYAIGAGLVLLLLAPLAAMGERLPLPLALLLGPAVLVPAWAGLAYRAAVARAHALSAWEAAPWWARAPHALALLAGLGTAGLAALAVGKVLVAEGWWGWGRLLAAALLVGALGRLLAPRMAARKPYARLAPVLRLAPLLAAGALAALALLGPAGEGTLAQRIAAGPRYAGSSALIAAAVDGAALLDGTRAWAGALLGEGWAPLALLWRLAGVAAESWLLALPFAAALIPGPEGRRLLAPSDLDAPEPPGALRLATVAALLAILGLVGVQAAARGEAWAAARLGAPGTGAPPALAAAPGPDAPPGPLAADGAPPRPPAPALAPARLRAAVEAERWGDLLCPEGTLAGIDALDAEVEALLAGHRRAMEAAAREGFDAMRARVPAFLDGYYSLSAEYLRTLNLLAGQSEDWLASEIDAALAPAGAMAPLEAAAAAFRAEPGFARLAAAREAMLGPCAALPSDLVAPVVTAARPAAALAAPVERIAVEARLAAAGLGGIAGGLAGAVAGTVAAKLLAKEAFGLAAEALAKMAASKAAGWLGGAAAGAVAGGAGGSVVPGLGTAAGAVVGGIVGGLAIGVATDAALLTLEEAVSRDAFEAQILAALDEAEAETLAALAE